MKEMMGGTECMKLNCHVGERYPSHRERVAAAQELTRKELAAQASKRERLKP